MAIKGVLCVKCSERCPPGSKCCVSVCYDFPALAEYLLLVANNSQLILALWLLPRVATAIKREAELIATLHGDFSGLWGTCP